MVALLRRIKSNPYDFTWKFSINSNIGQHSQQHGYYVAWVDWYTSTQIQTCCWCFGFFIFVYLFEWNKLNYFAEVHSILKLNSWKKNVRIIQKGLSMIGVCKELNIFCRNSTSPSKVLCFCCLFFWTQHNLTRFYFNLNENSCRL